MTSLVALTAATLALPAAAQQTPEPLKCKPKTGMAKCAAKTPHKAKCGAKKCAAKTAASKCAPKCAPQCAPKY